jgi:hypothetical protein
MVSVGTVWDRTMDVIAGRFAILASIALMVLFVPTVLQALVDANTSGSTTSIIGGLVSIAVAVATAIGALAITAVATDPSVDRGSALAIGGARVGPLLGILIVLVLVLFMAALPGVLLLVSSGFDPVRARANLPQEGVNLASAGFASLYFMALLIALFWVTARLVPLLAVIVNERLGLGAIRRSFALTRGSTMKLIGVLILYSIVMLVTLLAVTSIIGVVVRLVVGSEGAATVTFMVALATAAVTAVFSVLQSVFSGQFYLAARDARGKA